MNEDFTFDDEQTPQKQKTRPGVVKLILAAILAVLFIGFILQNSQEVPVEFLWWTWDVPMSLLLIATSVIAVIIWELAGYFQQRRKTRAAQQR